MSTPSLPGPARLVIGVFMADKGLLEQVTKDLVAVFGPVDMMSQWFSFHHTSYYEKEMGSPLFRRLFSFSCLIDQESLPDIKFATNQIEAKYAKNGQRQINIDPGYLVLERFVLATGKNFIHRLYLAKGIYADLTLLYTKDGFSPLPWTYPDYAQDKIKNFLGAVRKKFLATLRNSGEQEQKA